VVGAAFNRHPFFVPYGLSRASFCADMFIVNEQFIKVGVKRCHFQVYRIDMGKKRHTVLGMEEAEVVVHAIAIVTIVLACSLLVV
jgi:hypothetical protein